MFKFWYCPLLLCTTFLSNELVIGKSNFVAPSPLGKMCTQPIWSFPAPIQFNGFEKFFSLKFPKFEEEDYMGSHFNRIYKKQKNERLKAQRVQVIYRMHWHQMRWGMPHKDIDIPWPKPKQHRCEYQWDDVNMWTPPSMIYTCCKKKKTPAIWRCTDASGFHWMSNDHVPGLYCKTISFKN